MQNFLVSSRKYRPQTFESVVGQQHITTTLQNAIKANKLAQAFLFCGPRGVGKTTCARILAKIINMPDPIAALASGEYGVFDQETALNVFELDAASNNSVDDIRSLVEQVRFAPQVGTHKVYIIDEVHMLSTAAFNAFLKTLEEPPPYAIFILATTEKHKILPTILSRCQIFEFNRIKTDDIARHLAEICEKENIAFEPDALFAIAQKADGGLRDALSVFDQMVSFTNANLTYASVAENLSIIDFDTYYTITQSLHTGKLPEVLLQFSKVVQRGFEPLNFLVGIAEHFRNLLLASKPQTAVLLETSDNIRQKCVEQGTQIGVEWLLATLNVCNQFEVNHRNVKNIRFHVELALMKICYLNAAYLLSELPQAQPEKKKLTTNSTQNSVQEVVQEVAVSYTPQPAAKNAAGSYLLQKNKVEPNISAVAQQSSPELAAVPLSTEKATQANFEAAWYTFSAQVKERKPSIYAILNRQIPQITDNCIEIEVVNTVEKALLDEHRAEIAEGLKAKLNVAVGLGFVLNEAAQSQQVEPLKPNDIYKEMALQNPDLIALQKTFGLGIDW